MASTSLLGGFKVSYSYLGECHPSLSYPPSKIFHHAQNSSLIMLTGFP